MRKIILGAALFALLVLLIAPSISFAIPTSSDGLIIPECNPLELPRKAGACGFGAFAIMLANIINYMTIIIVPIAFCVIGYAGFLIMTSAGNSERVQKGYGMIKIAVIGIIILLSSYVLMRSFFSILLQSNISKTGIT